MPLTMQQEFRQNYTPPPAEAMMVKESTEEHPASLLDLKLAAFSVLVAIVVFHQEIAEFFLNLF